MINLWFVFSYQQCTLMLWIRSSIECSHKRRSQREMQSALRISLPKFQKCDVLYWRKKNHSSSVYQKLWNRLEEVEEIKNNQNQLVTSLTRKKTIYETNRAVQSALFQDEYEMPEFTRSQQNFLEKSGSSYQFFFTIFYR